MKGFGAQIALFAQKTNQNVDTVVREVIIEIATKVVKRSPVGNPDLWVTKNSDGQYVDYVAYKGYPDGYIGGQFRGNWFSSIDSPITTPEFGKIDRSGQGAISEAIRVANNAVGHVYYLTNNLPYAQRLEYGWSTQAPQGMVRITMAEVDAAIKKALSKLK